MTISRAEVQTALDQVTAKVPDLATLMPEINGVPFDGAVTIEFGDDGELLLVMNERGQKTIVCGTRDLNDLAYHATLQAVRSLAVTWERINRDCFPKYKDERRVTRAAKQVEIMGRINPRWTQKLRQEIPEIFPGLTMNRVEAHPLLSS